jgi:uncharacterized protein (TIGR01777 family)
MHVLIAGGTGSIGQRLMAHLLTHGYQVSVLSRRSIRPPLLPRQVGYLQWDGKTTTGWGLALDNIDVVVNLAGAAIAGARWTNKRKKLLLNSRVDSGTALVEAFGAAERKPAVLIQSSAVGYYGPQDADALITEDHAPGSDFMADICVQWEASTAAVEEMGVRRVVIRTGVVLDPDDGALPRLALPFKLMAGGPLGSGKQWFPWIHYFDEVDAVKFLIETETARGPFNLTAPNPLQNKDFAQAIGQAMNRPALIPTPAIALKPLLGELSNTLLNGQRVVPARLQALGYSFRFPEAEAALNDLLPQIKGDALRNSFSNIVRLLR